MITVVVVVPRNPFITSPDGQLACDRSADDDDDSSVADLAGLDILGGGTHDLSGLELTVIADSGDGLATPRDLEFDPSEPSHLYVVNRATNSVTILIDPNDGEGMTSTTSSGPGSHHFLVQPSSLAFGEDGDFATIQEMDEVTVSAPAELMGPVLWSTDYFEGGRPSHLDMLHNSPNGMGIAWQQERVWWVFDGYHNSITRYDFAGDHGPGESDHSSGEISRYVEGEVSWSENTPSHMDFDPNSGLLYIADTGNGRIAVLDVNSGSPGGNIGPNFDGVLMTEMTDAAIWTLVQGEDVDMVRPSGLALRDGVVYVSDNQNGVILGFQQESGELLDWVDLGLGSGAVMGIAFDAAGSLWIADGLGDKVLRLSVAR